MEDRPPTSPPDSRPPLAEARRIVGDLFDPNPQVYWFDFLFHVTLGWTAFGVALRFPTPSAGQVLAYGVCSLALYRSVIFIHELAHLRTGRLRAFRVVWNVVCGFPLMVPSFVYKGVHADHHKASLYGTKHDGEYLPFALMRPAAIVFHVLLVVVLPLLFVGRFLVLTPLCYLHPPLRRFAWERASSLVIDPSYRRPPPSARDGSTWRWQEALTSLYALAALSLVVAGVVPLRAVVLWYSVFVLVLLLNALRTLAAHRYANQGDRRLDHWEQYLDSVDIPGNPVTTALWAPVGLRYHATHHLFPALPYHALGEAHRRLSTELPEHCGYRQAIRPGLWDALRGLWREARLRSRQA